MKKGGEENMKRKILSVIVSILIVLVLSTGCGNDGSSSISNPLPEPTVDCGGEECIK
jgi:hypothetical protein